MLFETTKVGCAKEAPPIKRRREAETELRIDVYFRFITHGMTMASFASVILGCEAAPYEKQVVQGPRVVSRNGRL